MSSLISVPFFEHLADFPPLSFFLSFWNSSPRHVIDLGEALEPTAGSLILECIEI